jgi:hypothetical protein
MSFPKPTRARRYRAKILVGVAFLSVASAAAAQDAVTGTIEIIRAGTVGNQLHVSDMIEIQNRSTPPRTLSGSHTFEVYLPARARISSVIAAGPGNVATMISAMPSTNQPGHFSVNFPLQPGATKFAFNYDLPYAGRAVFPVRHSYALQQLAIMIPPTMRFSSPSTAFQVLETGNKNYRVRAIASLNPGAGPNFEISGTGPLPPIHASLQPPTPRPESSSANSIPPVFLPQTAQTSPATNTAPTPAPAEAGAQYRAVPPAQIAAQTTRSATPSWMILVILGLGLVAMSAAAIRVNSSKRAAPQKILRTSETALNLHQPHQPRAPAFLLEGLKEELFQLEAAKIRGTISLKDYDLTRDALQETVKRALRRVR